MDVKELSALGIKALKERAAKIDDLNLEFIKQNPGVTASTIHKILGFKIGRIHLSAERLANKGLVRIVNDEYGGQKIKLFFPTESVEKAVIKDVQPGQYDIAVADSSGWSDKAFAYAMTSNKIIISPKRRDDLDQIALKTEAISIVQIENKISFSLPYEFVLFYELKTNYAHISEKGGNIMVELASGKRKRNVKGSNKKNPKVLIVEDDIEWARSLLAHLKSAGLSKLEIATTVNDAKRMIRQFKPEIVIYDLRLKEGARIIDAFEIEKWAQENRFIHRHLYTSALPYDEQEIRKAISFGAETFYSKHTLHFQEQVAARIKQELQGRIVN